MRNVINYLIVHSVIVHIPSSITNSYSVLKAFNRIRTRRSDRLNAQSDQRDHHH